MYKRDRFVFISNLQDITCDPERPTTLKRDGYLLSARYSTPRRIQQILFARSRRNLIMSDNGNFSRMVALSKRFSKAGQALLDRAKTEQASKGKLSSALKRERLSLMCEISEACAEDLANQDKHRVIAEQLKIRPHLMIGLEDFTIPVYMMCGLLHPVFSPKVSEVRQYQTETRRLFQAEQQGKLSHIDIPDETELMCVLHAYDYASARSGARAIASKQEINAIAVSYGGPMTSRRWVSELNLGRKTIKFEKTLPEAYMTAQALSLGALAGFEDKVRLHILGAGSPILVVLTGLLAPWTNGLSLDSTAPFKDANQGRIYGQTHAYLKMKMERVAAYHLIEGSEYSSTSPFWQNFNRRYPSNWELARRKLGVTPQMDVIKLANKIKRNQTIMIECLPYFMKDYKCDPEFVRDVRVARSGSNFHVIQSICERIRRRLQTPERLNEWVANEIERYIRIAHPRWAEAARQTYEISIASLKG